MQRSACFSSNAALLIASSLVTALLCACGGGSEGASASGTASIDDATATTYAANATQIGSDTMDVADNAVLGAQALIAAGAGLSSVGGDRSNAMGAKPEAASTHACPGSGSATVSISGGTPQSQANGKLDAGEVYDVSFAACAGAAGLATLDGTLEMTVVGATGDSANGSLDVAMVATNLSLALPNGGAMLNGSTERRLTVSTDSDGTVHLSSHFTSPSLTLATHYRTRSSSFTLSNADIVRTATLVGGVLQSSTINGSHTLSATLPNASFSYSVATSGGTTYAADGAPTSGAWTITLPQTIVGVSIANGLATITIDYGKDGSVDRTITVPVPQLVDTAG